MLRYLTVFIAIAMWADSSAYQAAIAKWRQQREAELTADLGWLTVTGLEWLKEGANRVAGAPGVFELRGGKTVYRPDSGAAVTEIGPKTAITAGDLTLTV